MDRDTLNYLLDLVLDERIRLGVQLKCTKDPRERGHAKHALLKNDRARLKVLDALEEVGK